MRNVSSLSWLRRSAVNISSSSEYLPARIRFIALRLIAAGSGPDCDSRRAAVISAVPTILGQCRCLFRLEAAGLLDGAAREESRSEIGKEGAGRTPLGEKNVNVKRKAGDVSDERGSGAKKAKGFENGVEVIDLT